MSSTDNRVVKMQFDNDEFKRRAAETKTSLADLNKAVDTTGKNKGLLDLNSNMQRVSVTASKMAVVTTTALATITNKVVNAGLAMAKSLTLDPIRQGFQEYESLLTKQNVIQNATGKSAKFVKGILNDLNNYSDKTIYSFGNMTDAITKFVNAGVPLKQSVISIKGIANAAAFAGASSEEANRAMYAFSQSMSLGFIQLQDWNQIENANLGTQKFKNTLLEAGVAVGTLRRQGDGYVTASGKYVTASKGWRDGLQDQWATTEVLNDALGKYADTNTKLGRQAFKSAQEVRTFSAFIDTLKESIGSGWSQIFTALIGNLKQSTKMWTGLSNAIGGGVKSFFNWLTVMLTTWRKMGGFEKTIEGFRNILAPIGAIFDVIGTALRKAFPNSGSGSGKALYGLSAAFAAITSPLNLLAKLIRLLTNPLAVFFQIVKIGGEALKEIVGFIADFVKGVGGAVHLKAPSSGGFLGWIKDLGSAIADVIDQISKMIDKGKSLGDAFKSVHFDLPSLPSLPSLPDLGGILGGGGGGKGGKGGSALAGLVAPLQGINLDFGKISSGFKNVGKSAQDGGGKVVSAGEAMGNALGKVWDWFKKFMGDFNFDDLISSFNLAILATFMLSITRFFNALTKSFTGFAGIGDSVKGVLDGAGSALKSFQTQARAKLILNIAIALGILAVALWVLSKIPMKDLAVALIAMGITFKILNKSMESLTNMIKAMDGAKLSLNLIALSIALVAFAGAMVLLALAMLIMNKVDFKSVAKGLVTMWALVRTMETLGNLSKAAAKNMISGGIAIGLVAGSMLLLAAALLAFKLVDWESMGKAGVALAGVALAVGLLALIPYEGIAKVGVAMLLTSVGMNAMAVALIMFQAVKWESIGKLAVVLVALTIALGAITALGGPATVSGLVALSAAMVGLALAGLILNKVNWSSLAKMGVILLGLVVAVALFATILAVFLYVIAPVAPVLMGLAAAFALLGLGLLAFAGAMAIAMTLGAAGTAVFAALATGAAVAIAVFLQTLASEAPIMKDSFLKILQSLIDTIVEAVPMIIDGIKRLWAAIKEELGGDDKKQGVKDTGKSWMSSLMDSIKEKIPLIAEKAKDLAIAFLKKLASKVDDIALMGVSFVIAIIRGLGKKAGQITDAAADLIIAFATGIKDGLIKIVNAGIDLIGSFLHQLADAIRRSSGVIGSGITDVIDAMHDVGVDLVQGLINGIGDMFGQAMDKIGGLAEGMVKKAKGILHIFSPSKVFYDIGKFVVQGLTNGIQQNAASAVRAVASMVSGQIAVANEYVSAFIQTLDQQALAARAKADGLAAAAEKAAKAAKMTKGKKDDKAAEKLSKEADTAAKAADAAEARAQAEREKQDRAEQFQNASYLEKAQMRSEDAQNQLDAAKAAEAKAASEVAQANALDRQARARGVSKAERKRLEKMADDLRKQAAADAARANTLLAAARTSAADALKYQKLAGDEAAAAFQAAFDADAKAAADQAAFDKMTDAEKAAYRRKQAEELQAKAQADLTKAKELAYTDLEAANDLARQAQDEANLARQYLNDAASLEVSAQQGTGGGVDGGVLGTVVNLEPTDAAAVAMNDYARLYDAASAAAAATKTVEFNQYNTSPEPLSPTEVYRQTNNLLTNASDRLTEASQAA